MIQVGEKYGRLTVVEDQGLRGTKRYWLCRCDCGNERSCQTAGLAEGVGR